MKRAAVLDFDDVAVIAAVVVSDAALASRARLLLFVGVVVAAFLAENLTVQLVEGSPGDFAAHRALVRVLLLKEVSLLR